MAALLVVTLPGAIAPAVTRRGLLRVAAAVAAVLGVIGLLTSLSRAAWLGAVAAGVVAAGLLRVRPRLRRLVVAAGPVTVVAVLAMTPAGRDVAVAAATRIGAATDTSAGSTGTHLALARVALAITVDHPWLGIGQEVFPEVARDYAHARLPAADAALLDGHRPESPHNALLSISSGSGVPASLAYLGFVTAVAAVAVRAWRAGVTDAVPLLAAIVGHLTTDVFMTPEVSSSTIFWLLLGTARALPPRDPTSRRGTSDDDHPHPRA
jgi:O-antigen ligase